MLTRRSFWDGWRGASGSTLKPPAGPGGADAAHAPPTDDVYAVLGLDRKASDEAVRARWKALMRENHPDSLASRGVPQAMIDAASDRVARINAAYDTIKRERKL